MKTKRIAALLLMIIALVSFASCDMITEFIDSRTRPIPLIQTYNSSLEATRKMVPNDTLYVKVSGLEADEMYTVEVLDPDRNIITMMVTQAELNEVLGYGVIDTSPLWYDIGYEIDEESGALVLSEYAIDVKSFYIHVYDSKGSTDFELPFWFIATNTDDGRPKPILTSGKNIGDTTDTIFSMENAFFSKGIEGKSDSTLYPGGAPSEDHLRLTNELWIQVDNMTPLTGGDETKPVRIYVIPFSGFNIIDNTMLGDEAYFYFEKEVQEFYDEDGNPVPIQINWPEWGVDSTDADPDRMQVDLDNDTDPDLVVTSKIPYWAEGKAFSIFLDMMDNGPSSAGIYNERQEGSSAYYLDAIDGNGVAGFIVRETPADVADYTYNIQLASGGMFSWDYRTWTYDYDYRDDFITSGSDTKYTSHSGQFWGKGIKVIWNPYNSPGGWSAQGVKTDDIPTYYEISRLWGSIVDLYIIEMTDTVTSILDDTELEPLAYLSKRTLPVQYGCSNGWWQQTIWRAPMDPGNYVIVVDLNRDGIFNADSDLIDDVRKSDTDTRPGGFSVIAD
jgi:hypothetical protein